MYIAHRAHDPRVLSKTLRMLLPVIKQVLAQEDVDELVRLASDVRLEVVPLTPYSVRWHEGQNISDQITRQEEMASPKHVDNHGLVADGHNMDAPTCCIVFLCACVHVLQCTMFVFLNVHGSLISSRDLFGCASSFFVAERRSSA